MKENTVVLVEGKAIPKPVRCDGCPEENTRKQAMPSREIDDHIIHGEKSQKTNQTKSTVVSNIEIKSQGTTQNEMFKLCDTHHAWKVSYF